VSLINTYLRSVTAIVFAVILIFGTLGFNVNLHVCQSDVKAFNFFGKAESCVAMADGSSCSSTSKDEGYSKTPCCKDLNIFSFNSTQIVVDHDVLVSSSVSLIPQTMELSYSNFVAHIKSPKPKSNGPPDAWSENKCISHQSFLI
jgi:hypothetical protein